MCLYCHINTYLNKKDLFNSRLICQDWCIAFDYEINVSHTKDFVEYVFQEDKEWRECTPFKNITITFDEKTKMNIGKLYLFSGMSSVMFRNIRLNYHIIKHFEYSESFTAINCNMSKISDDVLLILKTINSVKFTSCKIRKYDKSKVPTYWFDELLDLSKFINSFLTDGSAFLRYSS